ncbi:uncharacterized protein BDV17DRAFT_238156 [Aspergillus undulatus]|uniref:uncharacterized protein n=1 Tax=Aspergillus undulatus TaxID=1810928 RepID=UPI003CCD18D8
MFDGFGTVAVALLVLPGSNYSTVYMQGRLRQSGVFSQRICCWTEKSAARRRGYKADAKKRSRPGREHGVQRDIGQRMLGRSLISVFGLGLSHEPKNRRIWKICLQEMRRPNDARRTGMQLFLLLVRGA